MVGNFDPYHKWLGIPPEDQPPDHYRLLGIRLFEEDPDVIEAAATQRIMLLRTFQTGKHGQLSQMLLNEVAAAKVCLLNPNRRAAYDARLREQLAAEATEPTGAAEAVEPPPPITGPPGDSALADFLVQADQPLPAARPCVVVRRKRPKLGLLIGVAALAGVVILGLILRGALSTTETALLIDWPKDQRKEATLQIDGKPFLVEPSGVLRHRCGAGPHRVVAMRPGFERFEETVGLEEGETKTVQPVWKKATGGESPPSPPPETTAEDQSPDKPAQDPSGGTAMAATDPQPVEPANGSPTEKPESSPPQVAVDPEAEQPEHQPPGEKKRLPVPSDDEQKVIADRLEELYRLSAANTLKQRLPLAEQLFDLGRRVTHNTTERFVLLWTAAELACDGGEAGLMLDAVETIGADYDVDVLSVKQKFLAQFAQAATSSQRIGSLVEQSLLLVDQALDERRYESAYELINTAYQASTRSAGKEYRKQLYDRRNEVQKLYQAWKGFQNALDKLKLAPDDADANLTVAHWLCFREGNWEQGLPHLVKGSDEALKTLARQELGSPPTDAAAQIKLADAWWDAAESLAKEEQQSMRRRARYWYEKAAPTLAGLEKVRIDRRLNEVAGVKGESPSAERPRPEEPPSTSRWADILQWADLKRDAISGDWKRQGKAIMTTQAEESGILLPVEVEGSYDLAIDFTRTSGDRSVAVFLPVGTRKCLLILSGWSGRSSGIGMIGGQNAAAKSNPTNRPGNITNGEKHALLVSVRLAGDQASIKVLLDDKPYIAWAGNQSLLRLHPNNTGAFRTPNRLVLASDGSPITFHGVRLRVIPGEASSITPIDQ